MTSNTLPANSGPTGRLMPWLLPAASLLLVALVYSPEPPPAPEPTARSTAAATGTPGDVLPIDHGALDWSRLPLAPDAAPMSVAAYGN